MKREIQEAIQDALAWAVSTPMYINWRSNQPFPGAGMRKSRRRGPTIPDFATHKDWEPGDDTNNIDWVASAQTNMNELVLRLYHEPRDINIVVVADSGATMRFGTTEVTKHQFVARLTASVLISAEKTHDLVGFVSYPDLGQKHLVTPKPAKGVLRYILQQAIESGADRIDSTDNVDAGVRSSRQINDLADALKRLPKARSLVFVVSDFFNLTDADRDALRRAARMHYVVCLGVYDWREQELPDGFGLFTLRDLSTFESRSIWLSAKSRRQYRENFEHFQASLNAFFAEARIHYTAFSTHDSPAAQQAIRELFHIYR